jgi:hypothetical protein
MSALTRQHSDRIVRNHGLPVEYVLDSFLATPASGRRLAAYDFADLYAAVLATATWDRVFIDGY